MVFSFVTRINAMLLAGAAVATGADEAKPTMPQESITRQVWGKMPDGRPVHVYALENGRGMTMRVTDFGCRILTLTAPDRDGRFADVVLGFDRLDEYLEDRAFFGGVVGRFGNRIAAGRFTLDGKAYTLATNNAPAGAPCHLHGGNTGYDRVLWESEGLKEDGRVGVRFRYVSRDGEEGYPGNLNVTVTYWLTTDNAVHFEYEATTDAPTPVNLTQHSYFNLAGHDGGSILNHRLMIAADHITPVDKGLIPTGELLPVAGSPFDFTEPTPIGKNVDADHEQIRFGLGYDHNFVVRDWDGKLRQAVTVYEPQSGRLMEVFSTEPGIQFYSGNFLDGSKTGKGGHAYQHRSGFCMETQHFPDSPNQPAFPSTILRPEEVYRHTAVYRFSAK